VSGGVPDTCLNRCQDAFACVGSGNFDLAQTARVRQSSHFGHFGQQLLARAGWHRHGERFPYSADTRLIARSAVMAYFVNAAPKTDMAPSATRWVLNTQRGEYSFRMAVLSRGLAQCCRRGRTAPAQFRSANHARFALHHLYAI